MANLFEADIIVSGGRGTTNDGLGLVKALADALIVQGVNADGRAAVRLSMKVLRNMHARLDKPAKHFVLKFILPLAFPERSSILPVCKSPKKSLPSTTILKHLFFTMPILESLENIRIFYRN